jgi:hypothetical protein
MKDQYYKPQYHGAADNAYVERFWKTRAEYPVTPALILVGADENTPNPDISNDAPQDTVVSDEDQ